ncbi:hypothetical protein GQ42DRAFT_163652 [Ramicandelaber brevisporus]|nr:hypothetical protein GQ42DRAFT_163652 [Ramicandelaber brevisporus]
MTTKQPVRVYTVELALPGESTPSKTQFFRLPPPTESYALRISIPAGSRAARGNPVLHTNYPQPKPFTVQSVSTSAVAAATAVDTAATVSAPPFERSRFYSVPFTRASASSHVTCDILVEHAGAYQFYATFSAHPETAAAAATATSAGSSVHKPIKKRGDVKTEHLSPTTYFVVEPVLQINHASASSNIATTLPLDGIVLQTVVPKWLGPLSGWLSGHLANSAKLGYNMIHFVPIQQRGESDSPYSIKNQLSLSSDLFSDSPELTESERVAQLDKMLQSIEQDHGMLSLIDMVYNHTANDSPWLLDHPEAGYNLVNSPHLIPAFELDEALLFFSNHLGRLGYPTQINSEADLAKIMGGISEHAIQPLKLWEFYAVDAKHAIYEFETALWTRLDHDNSNYTSQAKSSATGEDGTTFEQHAAILFNRILKPGTRKGTRLHKAIDGVAAVKFMMRHYGEHSNDLDKFVELFKSLVNAANVSRYAHYDSIVASILTNLRNQIRYQRLDQSGPKMGKITKEAPLIQTYFTRLVTPGSQSVDVSTTASPVSHTVSDNGRPHSPTASPLLFSDPQDSGRFSPDIAATLSGSDGADIKLSEYRVNVKIGEYGRYALANNGWVMNSDPMNDFIAESSEAYLRRDVIIWSDCVKLRYGASPADNPWLWSHMKSYTVGMAKLFHGFRIDNCHSTPLHVAEYLLDAARCVRKNLFVLAELFTGSEERDKQFVSRLGISSLIREAMASWDPRELSRFVHRYGGKPIGSLDHDLLSVRATLKSDIAGVSDVEVIEIPVLASQPHNLFMDCTHDNPAPSQKRTAADALPNAALTAMTCCATGSVKGYDELYPHLLELVGESRPYGKFIDNINVDDVGIGKAKKELQELHVKMAQDGYDEVHVHHEGQYIAVHRQHPVTREGYLLIAHTAFPGSKSQREAAPLTPTYLDSTLAECIATYRLEVSHELSNVYDTGSGDVLRGLRGNLVEISPPHLDVSSDGHTTVHLPSGFEPGSIALLRTRAPNVDCTLTADIAQQVDQAVSGLDLLTLNILLYRVDTEERDLTGGHGAYNVPGVGALTFAGLEGWVIHLCPIVENNDLGHPLCDHLRSGFWALDYIIDRLRRHASIVGIDLSSQLGPLIEWLDGIADRIRAMPNFLAPKFFATLVLELHRATTRHALRLMSPFASAYDDHFVDSLAMVSVQMIGFVKSTGLHPTQISPSMAAGLPHFATQHMRVWGRDVFISLPGLCLTLGRFDIARQHLLAFAGCVRHGLIPNLLDSARKPRYNARDATWWFLHCLQLYCNSAPDGYSLLAEFVQRRFLRSNYVEADSVEAYSAKNTLAEIVQEIMQSHADGIDFVEWNAGPQLDHAMSKAGFRVTAGVDWPSGLRSGSSGKGTGFVYGGSEWNCGTWMDKMGDSAKAGNLGKPATPRDGAAVEIVGLQKATLRWLRTLSAKQQNVFQYTGVHVHSKLVTYAEWDEMVQTAFEKHFYVPTDPSLDAEYHIEDSSIVNKRGIYRDTAWSTHRYTDLQLRPNFAVAMAVAPELFTNREHAQHAVGVMGETLLGPLGMRTLDPSDWAYRGEYNNADDGDDPSIAHGFNYHQGPEWLWCTGYYLRARLALVKGDSAKTDDEIHYIHHALAPLRDALRDSTFAGLPELTNANGAFCADSNPTQAWSTATLGELLADLKHILYSS